MRRSLRTAMPAATASSSRTAAPRRRVISIRLGALEFLHLGDEGGHDLAVVADDSQVGNGEDRRLGIAVDLHDGPRSGDPRAVLRGPGDPHGDVQGGPDSLAGLADLPVHWHPAFFLLL